jgi:ribonuclease-3
MAISWDEYVKERSSLAESKFLGEQFNDRELLIRALTRNAVLNEKPPYEELKTNGSQIGLDTIGDTVLDFVIIDHFSRESKESLKKRYSPEELNDLREFYGNNLILHKFAKISMELQHYVIWGNDEEDKEKWNVPTTDLLADCLEALIGAIYLDKGTKGVIKFMEKIQFFKNVDKITKV